LTSPSMPSLGSWVSWAVVFGLALGTFLIRYSFIGLFANRDIPAWLEKCLRFMVPAIFGAIVFSGVALVGGELAGWSHWPRYVAALIALAIAWVTKGSMVWTVVGGMAALHLLLWVAAAAL
jgi:branched-subunit amino acid transport protein